MLPINFEGAHEIKKPESMTDEDCSSLAILQGFTDRPGNLPPAVIQDVVQGTNWPYTLSCWQPSREDIAAINAGQPVWVRILSHQVHPIELLTTNEKGEIN